jgi:hypothetical protein
LLRVGAASAAAGGRRTPSPKLARFFIVFIAVVCLRVCGSVRDDLNMNATAGITRITDVPHEEVATPSHYLSTLPCGKSSKGLGERRLVELPLVASNALGQLLTTRDKLAERLSIFIAKK